MITKLPIIYLYLLTVCTPRIFCSSVNDGPGIIFGMNEEYWYTYYILNLLLAATNP